MKRNYFSSFPARLLFRLRHGNFSARGRTAWLRFCGVKIGKNTLLPKTSITWPHQLQIGNDCRLEPDIFFKFDGIWTPGRSIIIGDHVFIGQGCEFNIRKRIEIGNDCLIASGCKFIDHDHGMAIGQPMRYQSGLENEIVVGTDVWLGVNSVVLKGVTIGSGAVVGAGALVTRSIPPNEIWAGLPARKISSRRERD